MITLEVGKCYQSRLGNSEYICGTSNGFFMGSGMLYREDGSAIGHIDQSENSDIFVAIRACYDLVSEITIRGDVIRAKISYMKSEVKRREEEILSFNKKIQALNRDLNK